MQSYPIEKMDYQPQENQWGLLSLTLSAENLDFQLTGHFQLCCGQTSRALSLFQLATASNRPVQFIVHADEWRALNEAFDKVASLPQQKPPCQLCYQTATTPHFIDTTKRQLLIGVDQAQVATSAPLFALAKHLKNDTPSPIALLAGEKGFAFRIKPARFLLPLSTASAIGACSLLEDWHIPNRLATRSGEAGSLEGNAATLLQSWIESQSHQDFFGQWQVWVFFGNKKGQPQWLTFSDLPTPQDFSKVLQFLQSLDQEIKET